MSGEAGNNWRLHFSQKPLFSAADFADLHRKCFDGRGRAWSASEFEALRRDASLRWAEAIGGSAGGDETILIGFALIRVVFEEVELITLCRHPNWSGQSLGKALVERALKESSACGAATMFLEVSEGNLPARKLYERLGFREVGNRRGYYRNASGFSEDALVLRTELRAS